MPPLPASHSRTSRPIGPRTRPLALAALALLVLLPFLCNLHVTYSWSYLKLFALQAASLLACLDLLLFRRERLRDLLRASAVGLPMLLILLWAALSILQSRFRWAAVQPLVQLTYMALAVVALANLFADLRLRRPFVLVYAIAAAGACLAYVVARLATGSRWAYPFENPNVAASFAILPFAAGSAHAISALGRRLPARLGLVGALVAAPAAGAIIASRSAAALIAAAAALLLVIIFSFRGLIRRILIELVCIGLLVVALWPFLSPELWPQRWLEHQLGARPAMWHAAAPLVLERPLTGIGLGSFFVEFARVPAWDYIAREPRAEALESAHSVPLHVLIELGVIGLALAAWLVVRALRNAHSAARRADHPDRALIRGLVCGAIGVLLQSLVSDEIHQVEAAVELVIALALLGGIVTQWRGPLPSSTAAPRTPRFAAAAFLALFFIATAGSGLTSQIYLRLAVHTPQEEVLLRISRLRTSINVTWPCFRTLEARLKLAATYHQANHDYLALRELNALDRLAPNIGHVRRDKAALLLGTGRLDEAARAIDTYCQKNPFDRVAYDVWADLLREAAAVRQPNAARPDAAARLLAQVERRILDEVLAQWTAALDDARRRGKLLSPADIDQLLRTISDRHCVGTMKLDDARRLHQMFRNAAHAQPPDFSPTR